MQAHSKRLIGEIEDEKKKIKRIKLYRKNMWTVIG